MGLLMAAMVLLAGSVAPLGMVLGVAATYVVVGAGMLSRQGWSRWGFYILAGMTVVGAGEAALRAQVLERSVTWDRPIALAVGLFFAWGIWMLTRPGAKAEWRGKG
jgi:bacteriorhodopsin